MSGTSEAEAVARLRSPNASFELPHANRYRHVFLGVLHSSVKSPFLFEKPPLLSASLSSACTHSFLALRQPIDSPSLVHSSKNIGGVPLFFPFWNHASTTPVQSRRPSAGRAQTRTSRFGRTPSRPTNLLQSHPYAVCAYNLPGITSLRKTTRGEGLVATIQPIDHSAHPTLLSPVKYRKFPNSRGVASD
jgi:hypothetical protein